MQRASARPTIPDNVVKLFVHESAQAGIDARSASSTPWNWLPNLQLAIEARCVPRTEICEPALCYTGDILDERRDKYSLKYYVDLAKQFEKLGAHILGIKDMAGLLKPYAARKLVRRLRQEIEHPDPSAHA